MLLKPPDLGVEKKAPRRFEISESSEARAAEECFQGSHALGKVQRGRCLYRSLCGFGLQLADRYGSGGSTARTPLVQHSAVELVPDCNPVLPFATMLPISQIWIMQNVVRITPGQCLSDSASSAVTSSNKAS